jgi:hypothetical protein
MKAGFWITLVCSGLWAVPAVAWNSFGHMEAAAVAWTQLTPAAKTEATRLLKLNPQYSTWTQGVPEDQRDQVAFVKAATWPDQIKSLKDYQNDGDKNGDVAPNTPEASQNIGYADHFRHKYWHFIDEPFSTDGTALEQPVPPNAAGSTDENDWIKESFTIAKESVYAPPIRDGDGPYKLTKAYQTRSLRIANQRISLAGARIAAILNGAFK